MLTRNRAAQLTVETQHVDDGASPAEGIAKPITSLPGASSKRSRHQDVDAPSRDATASPAKHVLSSVGRLPGFSSKHSRRGRVEAHLNHAVASPAIIPTNPEKKLLGTSSKRSRQSKSAAQPAVATALRPAISAAKPMQQLPDAPKRSRQATHETHAGLATALRPASDPLEPTIDVLGATSCDSHGSDETQVCTAVVGDDGLRSVEAQNLGAVIAQIIELWRRRQRWHTAEKSLTVQCSAICRRYVGVHGKDDKPGLKRAADLLERIEEGRLEVGEDDAMISCLPLLAARDGLKSHRITTEKRLEKLAKSLPVYGFVENVRGLAALSLASLIGECGDLGSYKSVSALWKRLGLAVIHGERQRRVANDPLLAHEHGYSPRRRSVAWNVGACLMRSQREGDPYRAIYDAEKAKQLARELTAGHAHNRATRYMTKRLLAKLYGAWNGNARN